MMMRILVPTYTLRIEVKDPMPGQGHRTGCSGLAQSSSGEVKWHKYWNASKGLTGCDDVMAAIKDALHKAGITDCAVSFEKFEQV